jgi:hypothetical protein
MRDYDLGFSFFGSSWIVHYPNQTVHLCHRGKHVEFFGNPQVDGTIRYAAQVDLPKSANEGGLPDTPNVLGTIWYDCTKKFINDHASHARLGKTTVVNGVNTQVLEWDVSSKEVYKAFNKVNELGRNGGVLRLYLAPELGFALPLIEHLGTEGMVMTHFSSGDFKQVAPGIYLPMESVRTTFKPAGADYVVKYHIHQVEQINEQIPDEEFIIELPNGTSVGDARQRTHGIHFRVGQNDSLPIPDLQEVAVFPMPPSSGLSRWVLAVLMGAGAGAVAVVSYLIVKRRARRTV